MRSEGLPTRAVAVRRLLERVRLSRTADGFGHLRADGTVDAAEGLQCYLVARAVHVLALGVLLGHRDVLPDLLHGLRSLQGPLHDPEDDGWWTARPGDDGKQAYTHAFVLLAAASATRAGAPGAEVLLQQALEVWERRFWDEQAGAAVEQWDRGWTRLDGYRGANANMHTVEALLAVADAAPAQAEQARSRALRITERLVHREAGGRGWRLPEHFDAAWQAEPEHGADAPHDPFRPYGVTVGHQFEWARLCLHLDADLGADAPAWLRDDAVALYAAARDRGWRADGRDGFVYTLDWHDRPVSTQRMHWVLAEAVSAAAVLATAVGGDAYDADLQRWQRHAAEVFADPATGNWHHELTPDGALSTTTWSGQPDTYHVVQALLLPGLPVLGSLAAAVASLS